MAPDSTHKKVSFWGRELKASFMAALWLCLLTAPMLAFKINPNDSSIVYRWHLLIYVAGGGFVLSALWRLLLARRDRIRHKQIEAELGQASSEQSWLASLMSSIYFEYVLGAALIALMLLPTIRRLMAVDSDDAVLPAYHWPILIYVAGAWVLLRLYLRRRARVQSGNEASKMAFNPQGPEQTWVDSFMKSRYRNFDLGFWLLILASVPTWSTPYTVNILITALIYVTLGLGLNIVVGVSGLLNLGYVAFYAIGAYTYALLNYKFGLGFWVCLPLGALTATILGLLLGFPVLRLRGDYLAIVTLGFGEIVRLLLTNMEVTRGPRGIGNISPPGLFGLDLNGAVKPWIMEWWPYLNPNLDLNKAFLFFIILAVVVLTIVAVFRLENSRLGRAWLALREDEIACQAMGIDRTRAKLTAFALGATWAGLAGVVFAAQVTFINPTSFTFMQSVMILSIVVLGGMGSIPGVIIGAVVLILLPEYLRTFSDYRMLLFGAAMVLMMVFRPGGLIQSVRQAYVYEPAPVGPETRAEGESR